MSVVLSIENLSKAFGSLQVTDDVSLQLQQGECHALIGPNGAGKTTLINLITGALAPETGKITLNGTDLTSISHHQRAAAGLGRTFQITSIIPGFSALENVALAAQAKEENRGRFMSIAAHDPALNEQAAAALDLIGLSARKEARGSDMSHGEHRLLELAMAIAGRPHALLLDEPMAGLGRGESNQLTETLRKLKQTVPMLMVEHDMEAVFNLADRISVLASGKIVASGTPKDIRENAKARAAYLGDEML